MDEFEHDMHHHGLADGEACGHCPYIENVTVRCDEKCYALLDIQRPQKRLPLRSNIGAGTASTAGARTDNERIATMAWCENCGNGFAGDGGPCPTCGFKVAYSAPAALPAPAPAIPVAMAQAGGGFNLTRLIAAGFWVATFLYGSFLHDGATASTCLLGALVFSAWAICGGR